MTLVYICRAETSRQFQLNSTLAGDGQVILLKFFTVMHTSANDHESAVSIDFGLQINFSK